MLLRFLDSCLHRNDKFAKTAITVIPAKAGIHISKPQNKNYHAFFRGYHFFIVTFNIYSKTDLVSTGAFGLIEECICTV